METIISVTKILKNIQKSRKLEFQDQHHYNSLKFSTLNIHKTMDIYDRYCSKLDLKKHKIGLSNIGGMLMIMSKMVKNFNF